MISLFSHVIGIAITSGSNDFSFDNVLHDYSPMFRSSPGLVARCITGLGPIGGDNLALGGWVFKSNPLVSRECSVLAVEQDGAPISDYAGVVDLHLCQTLPSSAEGVYTCTMMNSSMMMQSMRVGLYISGRSKSFHIQYTCYFLLLYRTSNTY